jgi:predicted DNA-binding protein
MLRRHSVSALPKVPTPMIKVKPETHARLRALSEIQHKPMGDIVSDLVDKYEEELFWKRAKQQIDRLKADPVAWQGYLEEMAEWDELPNDVLEVEGAYDGDDGEGRNEAGS